MSEIERLLRFRQKRDALIVRIKELKPGTMLTWAWLEDQLELKKRTEIYPIINAARPILITMHGIMLETKYREGYLIKPVGQQINLCIHRKHRGMKNIFRAGHEAACIRVNEIQDSTEKETTMKEVQQLANLTGMMIAAGEKHLH